MCVCVCVCVISSLYRVGGEWHTFEQLQTLHTAPFVICFRAHLCVRKRARVYIYIYIYIYVCVCVCVVQLYTRCNCKTLRTAEIEIFTLARCASSAVCPSIFIYLC